MARVERRPPLLDACALPALGHLRPTPTPPNPAPVLCALTINCPRRPPQVRVKQPQAERDSAHARSGPTAQPPPRRAIKAATPSRLMGGTRAQATQRAPSNSTRASGGLEAVALVRRPVGSLAAGMNGGRDGLGGGIHVCPTSNTPSSPHSAPLTRLGCSNAGPGSARICGAWRPSCRTRRRSGAAYGRPRPPSRLPPGPPWGAQPPPPLLPWASTRGRPPLLRPLRPASSRPAGPCVAVCVCGVPGARSRRGR
jgi:hypothetical protein